MPFQDRQGAMLAHLGEHLAEVAVRADVIRLEVDGGRERRLGLLAASLPVQRHAEPAMQRGMIGDPERVTVGRLRLDVAALAAQAKGEVGARPDVERVGAHGLAQHDFGRGVPAGHARHACSASSFVEGWTLRMLHLA
jgi:hypothetical protein